MISPLAQFLRLAQYFLFLQEQLKGIIISNP